MSRLSKPLLDWFDRHGRRDLPWQQDVDDYGVWLSEIMLQQTQVATVIPYFERFTSRYDDVRALAAAPIDAVLHLWSGLGYYARARNLHATANIVATEHDGKFPRDIDALVALPGIGRSTAGAILALTYGDRHPILDGNVKRVLARYFEVAGWPGEARVQRALWEHAEAQTPRQRVAEYTQAVMDLGATVCTARAPRCDACPLVRGCGAHRNGTQTDHPGRKPPKTLPRRQTRFVVVRAADDGAVLLERRPPSGIWGGLWSFPEIDDADDIHAWCASRGFDVASVPIEQDRFRHTFTHFHLEITPVAVTVRRGASVMDSDQWLWYNVDEPPRIGLAKPVLSLLRGSSTQNPREERT